MFYLVCLENDRATNETDYANNIVKEPFHTEEDEMSSKCDRQVLTEIKRNVETDENEHCIQDLFYKGEPIILHKSQSLECIPVTSESLYLNKEYIVSVERLEILKSRVKSHEIAYVSTPDLLNSDDIANSLNLSPPQIAITPTLVNDENLNELLAYETENILDIQTLNGTNKIEVADSDSKISNVSDSEKFDTDYPAVAEDETHREYADEMENVYPQTVDDSVVQLAETDQKLDPLTVAGNKVLEKFVDREQITEPGIEQELNILTVEEDIDLKKNNKLEIDQVCTAIAGDIDQENCSDEVNVDTNELDSRITEDKTRTEYVSEIENIDPESEDGKISFDENSETDQELFTTAKAQNAKVENVGSEIEHIQITDIQKSGIDSEFDSVPAAENKTCDVIENAKNKIQILDVQKSETDKKIYFGIAPRVIDFEKFAKEVENVDVNQTLYTQTSEFGSEIEFIGASEDNIVEKFDDKYENLDIDIQNNQISQIQIIKNDDMSVIQESETRDINIKKSQVGSDAESLKATTDNILEKREDKVENLDVDSQNNQIFQIQESETSKELDILTVMQDADIDIQKDNMSVIQESEIQNINIQKSQLDSDAESLKVTKDNILEKCDDNVENSDVDSQNNSEYFDCSISQSQESETYNTVTDTTLTDTELDTTVTEDTDTDIQNDDMSVIQASETDQELASNTLTEDSGLENCVKEENVNVQIDNISHDQESKIEQKLDFVKIAEDKVIEKNINDSENTDTHIVVTEKLVTHLEFDFVTNAKDTQEKYSDKKTIDATKGNILEKCDDNVVNSDVDSQNNKISQIQESETYKELDVDMSAIQEAETVQIGQISHVQELITDEKEPKNCVDKAGIKKETDDSDDTSYSKIPKSEKIVPGAISRGDVSLPEIEEGDCNIVHEISKSEKIVNRSLASSDVTEISSPKGESGLSGTLSSARLQVTPKSEKIVPGSISRGIIVDLEDTPPEKCDVNLADDASSESENIVPGSVCRDVKDPPNFETETDSNK